MSSALDPVAARRVFYLLTFLRWFPVGLVVAIVTLLPLERGLSLAEVLSATAVAGVVIMLLELPTSGFADSVGRKPVLVVASVVGVLSSLAYLAADTFWLLALASALQGVFRALDSGPLEAWYVDSVHVQRPGADVHRELSVAGTVLGGGIAVGALVSGLLVWWHPWTAHSALVLPVLVWVVLGVLDVVAIAVLLREPPRPVHRRALDGVREAPRVVLAGLRLASRNRVLLGLLGVEACWSLGMLGFETFTPIRLSELLNGEAAAAVVMGPTASVGWAVFAAGSALAGLAARRWGIVRVAAVSRVLNGLGVVGLGLAIGPVGLVAGYLFAYGLHGACGPLHSALLHREADATNRATVMSLGSMVSFATFAVAAPLAGLLAGTWSTATTLLLLGAVSAAGAVLYLPAYRAERARLRVGLPPGRVPEHAS